MIPPQTELPGAASPIVIPRPGHRISRADIDENALKVLYRLHRHGHIAYLVGGGVRDLLLGRKPKDFDISTSAHPNEIKKLFANCRLIGRRFRLAHIYFRGNKIIEVSTFRTSSEFNLDDGPIRSDNTFGTPAEDSFRRDFTVNALFYNISDFTVIDFVNGLNDLQDHVIRTIGDPSVRFTEDPIRMLRGVRFAALLDFTLDPSSQKAIRSMKDQIWQGATPRILEEIFRMFGRGKGRNAFALLRKLGLLETIFPEVYHHVMEMGPDEYMGILSRLDASYHKGKELTLSLILSTIFYPLCRRETARDPRGDRIQTVRKTITPLADRIQVPKRVQDTMRQTIAAQTRLFGLESRKFRPRTILRKSYFSGAMELFELSAGGDAEGKKLIAEWKKMGSNFPRDHTAHTQRPRRRGRRDPTKRKNRPS
ncbi:MAG: polynucleotide adenylyltransferase PcnB [bacterium]